MSEIINIKDSGKMVCPFRTEIVMYNKMSDENVPQQVQTSYFPECYYGLCPYYDSKATAKTEKCLKTMV